MKQADDENAKLFIWVLQPLTHGRGGKAVRSGFKVSPLGGETGLRVGLGGQARFLHSLMACCACAVLTKAVPITRVEHSRLLAQLSKASQHGD